MSNLFRIIYESAACQNLRHLNKILFRGCVSQLITKALCLLEI